MTLIRIALRLSALLFPWVYAQSMVYTHTQTRTVRNDAGRTITGTLAPTGDSEDIRNPALANDTTQVFSCAWVYANIQSFQMKASIAATVTFKDDSDVTVGTLSLTANKPVQWATGDATALPFTGDVATFNVSSAATGTLELMVLQNSGIVGTAALTGTFLTTPTEGEVVTGGQTIIITLTGATWAAAGAAFDGQRQAIIDGMTATTDQAAGWNAEVKTALGLTDVVRTSSSIVTVTLPAVGAYSIASNETVVVTVPAAATSAINPIIATPSITIVAS